MNDNILLLILGNNTLVILNIKNKTFNSVFRTNLILSDMDYISIIKS
jgi:hypothetical protein